MHSPSQTSQADHWGSAVPSPPSLSESSLFKGWTSWRRFTRGTLAAKYPTAVYGSWTCDIGYIPDRICGEGSMKCKTTTVIQVSFIGSLCHWTERESSREAWVEARYFVEHVYAFIVDQSEARYFDKEKLRSTAATSSQLSFWSQGSLMLSLPGLSLRSYNFF